jgi:hypothetical protein
VRAAAARDPGEWIYVMDPELDPDEEVPPAGIAGAWKASDDAEGIVEFVPNPGYRPSPTALGWPPAKTRLERYVQLRAAGLIGDRDLIEVLREEPVWVDPSSEHRGGADPVVYYTSPDAARAAGVPRPAELSGARCSVRGDGALRLDTGTLIATLTNGDGGRHGRPMHG